MTLTVEEVVKQLAWVEASAKQYRWVRAPLRQEDIPSIQEASEESPFDPLKLRSSLMKNPHIFVKELRSDKHILARVIVITEKGHIAKIPWDLYRSIFTAFGKCRGKPFWKALVFASLSPRLFPPPGEQPTQAHVNGGYAQSNDPQSVVIYREEESERVLVHELLHACGSDNFNHEEWEREARTETWAELFLIGILAKGSVAKGLKLWRVQAQWIADKEAQLQRDHNVVGPSDYAYRYTVGRRDVLKDLGLPLPQPSGTHLTSLRFTTPALIHSD